MSLTFPSLEHVLPLLAASGFGVFQEGESPHKIIPLTTNELRQRNFPNVGYLNSEAFQRDKLYFRKQKNTIPNWERTTMHRRTPLGQILPNGNVQIPFSNKLYLKRAQNYLTQGLKDHQSKSEQSPGSGVAAS